MYSRLLPEHVFEPRSSHSRLSPSPMSHPVKAEESRKCSSSSKNSCTNMYEIILGNPVALDYAVFQIAVIVRVYLLAFCLLLVLFGRSPEMNSNRCPLSWRTWPNCSVFPRRLTCMLSLPNVMAQTHFLPLRSGTEERPFCCEIITSLHPDLRKQDVHLQFTSGFADKRLGEAGIYKPDNTTVSKKDKNWRI